MQAVTPPRGVAAIAFEGREKSGTLSATWKRAVGVAGRGLQMLWKFRLGWIAGHSLLVVTHVGRRTGKQHRTVLYVQRYDGADV